MKFFKKQTIYLCALWAVLCVGKGLAVPGEEDKVERSMICLSACAGALPEKGPLFYSLVPQKTEINAYLSCTFTPSSSFVDKKKTHRPLGGD